MWEALRTSVYSCFQEEYPAHEDTDNDEVGSATASDVVGGDDALVEILETEVRNTWDRWYLQAIPHDLAV